MNRNCLFVAASLALLIAASASVDVSGQPAVPPDPDPDPDLRSYSGPSQLADIGAGRKIHVLCMGAGTPTVILSAGSGNWAETWRKVQPALAKKTRVCTWDRAGFGFSSPSPEPQDVMHTTADLEKALRAAEVNGPYVMVGHSLGGLETLLFADRHQQQVVGLVLEEPSFPGQMDAVRQLKSFYAAGTENQRQAELQSDLCMKNAQEHKGDVAGIDPRCLAFPRNYPAALTEALRPLYADPAGWVTRASLSAEFEKDTAITLNKDRSYGDIPLIVLTATEAQTAPKSLAQKWPEAQQEMIIWQKEGWPRGHSALASLSSRGEDRLVPGTTHYIHLIKPEVVIAAIEEVVDAARRRRMWSP